MLSILSFAAAAIWVAIVLLPWRPWSTHEVLEVDTTLPDGPSESGGLTVVIPARNEAAYIRPTLLALAAQGGSPKIIVVDDHSDDDTAHQALSVPPLDVEVIPSAALPEGWSGKLWALEQGLARV
ncbi:MAG: glycosyltransferase, partial [Methylotetracoccus sp.]|nr:glycosyltransferase [Methylotetracoccus sp.]